ncbi:hypothetical protein L1887_53959 [Cichorium endivia]|nr:hypothetical protein L1887_53959 [Cichorium endivia]
MLATRRPQLPARWSVLLVLPILPNVRRWFAAGCWPVCLISHDSKPASCEMTGPAFGAGVLALALIRAIAAGDKDHCSSCPNAPAGDPGRDGVGDAAGDGEAGVDAVAGVSEVVFEGVEGEPRCINLSAFTRPLSAVTVAERPGGADMAVEARGPLRRGRCARNKAPRINVEQSQAASGRKERPKEGACVEARPRKIAAAPKAHFGWRETKMETKCAPKIEVASASFQVRVCLLHVELAIVIVITYKVVVITWVGPLHSRGIDERQRSLPPSPAWLARDCACIVRARRISAVASRARAGR